jgi:beta-lactamase class A
MRRSRLFVTMAIGCVMLLLGGCAAPVQEAPSPSPSATQTEIPDTPAGQVTQWILDEMNAVEDTTAAVWSDRLHPDFVAQVSAEDVAQLINRQIRPARPLVPTGYTGDEREAVTTVAGEIGEPFEMSVAIDSAGLITGFLIGPATPPHEPAQSLGEVTDRLAALPGETRVLVTLDGEPVIEDGSDEPAPIGSIFKLYVLAAVADAVAAGTMTWDEPLVVTDEVRSLPSGELQDLPDGTEVTARQAAEKMISISDNTATDMLMARVGRDAVEAAVVDLGHAEPAQLRPFPTTRELFALLWGGHEDLVDRWAAGDEAERRSVLDDLDALPFDVTASDATDTPRWPERIEWFASPKDVTAAHEGLRERGAADPVVTEILAINPGLPLDAAVWPLIAFKGGSSPGVVAGSWRAERADGAVLSIVVQTADEDSAISPETQTELFGLVRDVFTLLES